MNKNFCPIQVSTASLYLESRKINAINKNTGKPKILDKSRKNLVLHIRDSSKVGVIIKQPKVLDSQSKMDIRNEGALYIYIKDKIKLIKIKNIFPSIIDFDLQNTMLVTKMEVNNKSLLEYIHASKKVSPNIFFQLGRKIGVIHKHFQSLKDIDFLLDGSPNLDYLLYPKPEILRNASTGNIEILGKIENAGYESYIKKALSKWNGSTLVHLDLKWDNILIKGDRVNRIVDWELARFGDPAWDIGKSFQNLLKYWINSLNFTKVFDKKPTELLVSQSQDIKQYSRALWKGYYVSNLFYSTARANNFLLKAINYCAICLIQAAYEMTTVTHSITTNAIYMLQLAANIFKRPSEAIAHLMGLPLYCRI